MTEFSSFEQVARRLSQTDERIGEHSRMQCRVCWHVYDPAQGCIEHQTPPMTAFTELPDWWTCPGCGAPKTSFLILDESDDSAS